MRNYLKITTNTTSHTWSLLIVTTTPESLHFLVSVHVLFCCYSQLHVSGSEIALNPRRACAARVTVLGLCVCLLLNISLFTCLFVPQTILTFSVADDGGKF